MDRDEVISEMQLLRARVYELETVLAQREREAEGREQAVRDEVCEEMLREMAEMETSYQLRVENEVLKVCCQAQATAHRDGGKVPKEAGHHCQRNCEEGSSDRRRCNRGYPSLNGIVDSV